METAHLLADGCPSFRAKEKGAFPRPFKLPTCSGMMFPILLSGKQLSLEGPGHQPPTRVWEGAGRAGPSAGTWIRKRQCNPGDPAELNLPVSNRDVK